MFSIYFNLTVVHSLNHSLSWDTNVSAAEQAETDKTHKYAMLCEAAGIGFIPVGVDTFGAPGVQGRAFLTSLFRKYAGRRSVAESQRYPGQYQSECWQRYSVALHKGVARQLNVVLSRGETQTMPFRLETEQ